MKVEWDLSHLYTSDEAWGKDRDVLSTKIDELDDLIGHFLDSEENFLQYIKCKIEVNLLIEKVYCYPKRHLDLDSSLENYRAMFDEALALYARIQVLDSAFEKGVVSETRKVVSFLENEKLKPYSRLVNLILRRSEHILEDGDRSGYTNNINKIRQDYRDLFANTVHFGTVEIDGEEKVVDRTSYAGLISDVSQSNRKKIFDVYTEAYASHSDRLAEMYVYKLAEDISLSKREKYPTLLSKKLFELELPDEIVDKLIQTIDEHLDVMHKYVALKKGVLGLQDYHVYDASMSLCDIPKIEYTLEETMDIIREALGVLGEDYISLVNRMFAEGWVDVYPKDNKRTMSFTCISYVGVPYVLVNYNGSIDSARTLAHELGHAGHVYYSKTKNSFEYFEFSSFLSEIASKVNEILVNEYMMKNCSKEEEIYLLNNIISSLGNSLFGQMLLTKFEHAVIGRLSSGEPVDRDYLNDLYMSLSREYNGDSLVYDDNVKYGWCKIPHFVMQETYYLFQYTTGTAIATDIAYRILSGEEGFVEKYKNFLSLGNSVSIEEALAYIGIDLRNGHYVESAINVLSQKIEKIQDLLREKRIPFTNDSE